ncbi:hypothetical protein Y032_0032g2475 [Ancylostoma ceylanicum]|uniref:Uncharacterized protein n=1 Tax=Ancylostoma ceylanicum TaxID=53326 RepID=A0A016UMY3_9BILA|nr:hypothetical protein Y032_0032g2475 [Ancylostoma ceylanicum]
MCLFVETGGVNLDVDCGDSSAASTITQRDRVARAGIPFRTTNYGVSLTIRHIAKTSSWAARSRRVLFEAVDGPPPSTPTLSQHRLNYGRKWLPICSPRSVLIQDFLCGSADSCSVLLRETCSGGRRRIGEGEGEGLEKN